MACQSKRAVFLDRDGVINCAIVHSGLPYPPPSLESLEIMPFVEEALFELRKKGFKLIVVTNQPDVGRGTQQKETVQQMHRYLIETLPLDEIIVCWHGHDGKCECRKPLPGMLLKGADSHKINLDESYMIGDRWKDINAGNSAGCRTVFIDHNYNEGLRSQPDFITTSIREACRWIIEDSRILLHD